MLNLVMTTMVIVAMGATVWAVPVETATRPDAARGEARPGDRQTTPAPPAPPATPREPTAPSPRDRATAAREAARAQARREPAYPARGRACRTGRQHSMYRLDYEISLPKGMGVDVRNVSGSVALSDVAGDVRVEALSGSITGRGLSRLRSLRTMSGDIMVEASTLVGDANLQ